VLLLGVMIAVPSQVKTGLVVNRVEGRLVLPGILGDHVFVQDRVVHHDGQAVDEAFLSDGLDLRDTRSGYALGRLLLRRLPDGVFLLPASGE